MGQPIHPTWVLEDYAFYTDGTETGAVIIGTVGTQQTLDVDTPYHCRLAISDVTGTNQTDEDLILRWQYNLAGGGWNTVTATTPLQFVDNANLTDGDPTTNRQPVGTGTFFAGLIYESADEVAQVYQLVPDETTSHTEVLLHFQIDSAQVTNGQEILIKCVDMSTGVPVDFDAASIDADINVNEALAAINITADKTEDGDTQAATVDVIVSTTADKTEDGDTQSATVDVLVNVSANLTEEGDSQSASIEVVSAAASITGNTIPVNYFPTHVGWLFGRTLDRSLPVSKFSFTGTYSAQTEYRVIYSRGVEVVAGTVTLSADQTEDGDTQLSEIDVLAQVAGNQLEDGDTQLSELDVLAQVAGNQLEDGDTQLSELDVLAQVAGNQAEDGDGQSAAVDVVDANINILGNQTEDGDTQLSVLDVFIQVTGNQAEDGDTQLSVIDTLVQVTGNQAEDGDTTLATVNVAPVAGESTDFYIPVNYFTTHAGWLINTTVNKLSPVTGFGFTGTFAAESYYSLGYVSVAEEGIVANQTEEGDGQSVSVQVVLQLSVNQTEDGDSQAASVDVVDENINILGDQTEDGDSQVASVDAHVPEPASLWYSANWWVDGTYGDLWYGTAIEGIAANIYEEGDSQSVAFDVILQLSVSQIEDGDTQSVTLDNVVQLISNQAEDGDTQSSSIVGVPVVTLSVNQTEDGDSQAVSLDNVVQLSSTQSEDGDSQVVQLDNVVQLSVNQTEDGDTQAAPIVGILTAFIVSNQLEDGDSQVASLGNVVQLFPDQVEEGDTQTAVVATTTAAIITASNIEEGDATLVQLDVIVKAIASQTEDGDTQVSELLGIIVSTLAAVQVEEGDITSASVTVVVGISPAQNEDGDSQNAVLAEILIDPEHFKASLSITRTSAHELTISKTSQHELAISKKYA